MPIYKMEGKKDGRQKYRVRVNYRDRSGKGRQVDRIAFGLDDAKFLELRLTRELKDDAPDSSMTVRELLSEYQIVKKHEVRESTLNKTMRILEYHVMPTFENARLDKLNTAALQRWKTAMENKNLSLTTRQNVFREFNAMLNFAVKMEHIAKNPLSRLGNFRSSMEVKRTIEFYTAEEFKLYKAAAEAIVTKAEKDGHWHEWGFFVFFAVAFYTGLRKGEIHALQWDDINGKHLTVNRSITQKLKGGDRETPPKNMTSIRTIQIPQPLIETLADHKNRCENIEGFGDHFKVCGGLRSLRDSTVQNRNELYAKAAGLKTIRIHDFRHSHASLLANEKINIQEIARRLGHAKIEITWNIYSHLYPREEERAIEILDKIV